MADAHYIQFVREQLAQVVAPDIASAVIFAALDGAEVPSTRDETLAFVREALMYSLVAQVGEDIAEDALPQLLDAVTAIPDGPQSLPTVVPVSLETREMHRNVGPTRVAILGAQACLSLRMQAALGDEVMPFDVPTYEHLGNTAEVVQPALVLLDATGEALGAPAEVATALGTMHPRPTVAIWGADTPVGERLLGAVESAGIAVAPLPRDAGIDPLLDLVRAGSSG